MAGTAATNPDVQHNDNPVDGSDQLVDYAYGRALEYAAALRFVGMLAGVGSSADVENARNTVKGVAQALFNPDELLPIEERYARSSAALADANSRVRSADRNVSGVAGPDGPVRATSFDLGQLASSREGARRAAEAHAPIKDEYDKLPWFYERWWNSAWSTFTEAYDNAIAAIENGTWKMAAAKLAIDAGFALVENAVLIGLATFTGGVAAAAIKIVRVASLAADAAGGVKRYTGKVRISVTGTRHPKAADGRLNPQGQMHAERSFRDIEPEKEAKGAEKKVLGEENQGNTTPTRDAGDTSTRGGHDDNGKGDKDDNSDRSTNPDRRWKKKKVLGRTVYQRDDLIDPNYVNPINGKTNLELMQNGNAPFGPDGRRLELHHMIQEEGMPLDGSMAPLAEVTASFHSKNFNTIHLYKRNDPGYISWRRKNPNYEKRYEQYRGNYWEIRADDLEPSAGGL